NTIYQDKDGFIWFATFEGMSIYDGYHFKNYTKENGALTSDVVLNFFERSSNEVWVKEPAGFDVFINRKKARFIPISFPDDPLLTRDGRVLSSAGGTMYEIRNNKVVPVSSFCKGSWVQDIGNYFLTQDFPDSVYLEDHSLKKIAAGIKGEVFKDRLNRL